MTSRAATAVQYRHDIDGLRAVAVILIVFYHARLSNLPGGFIGVDVFFVISGYLITRLIVSEVKTGTFSFSGFYMRRLRRLGPALLATVALTLIAGWLFLPPSLYQDTAASALAALASVSNFYFWQQTGYFDTASAYKPLLHTWSLAVEEQFYLVWPLALLLGLRYARPALLLWLILAFSTASLAFSQYLLPTNPSLAFFMAPLRFYEFAAGAVLALTGWQARGVVLSNAASFGGLMVIFYAGHSYTDATAFPGINALVPALATALMIYAGPEAVMNRALALAPIRYIGRISYSVYLVHWPFFVFALFLFGQAATTVQILGLIGAALFLGAVMYHLVETPFRNKQEGGFAISGKALGRFSLAGAALIGIVSWQIYAQRGFPQRYGPEIQRLLSNQEQTYLQRFADTREWSCNATENSVDVYFAGFDDCHTLADDKIIVVLGDSHAADVWMGLHFAFPDRTIVQLTGNGCNFTKALDGNSFCAPFMQFWQRWIAQNAPDIAAIIYVQSGGSLVSRGAGGIERPDPALIGQMDHTLAQFAPANVPFFMFGPRLSYAPTIDIAIARSADLETLRHYFKTADHRTDLRLDAWLADFYKDKDIRYISTARTVCTPYCPTLTAQDELFVVDHSHWSRAGAIVAVTALVDADPVLREIFR